MSRPSSAASSRTEAATWPFAPEEVMGHFDGVSDADIDKVAQIRPGQTVRLHWSRPRV